MSSRDPHVTPPVEVGPLHEAGAPPHVTTGQPIDHTREHPALEALHRRGFTAEFVVEDEMLRVGGTDRRFHPEEIRILDYYRFEGTSDPDDMSVIYALETRDGTRGTLTDAFGAYADAESGAMINRMRMATPTERSGWRRALVPAAIAAVVAGVGVMMVRRRAA